MKNLSIIIILGLSIGFLGCKKLTTFKIHQSVNISIPASGIGSVPNMPTVPVQSSSQSSFKSNGTDASHVKEIKLEKLSLTIINSTTQNFDFLSAIHIYISAPGVAEQEIAYLDPVPLNGSTVLDLTSTSILLDDYIKSDSYSIRTAATTRSINNVPVDIRADMTFSVRATLHK
jgi:hypothetical protein